jgi:hypothetical protein
MDRAIRGSRDGHLTTVAGKPKCRLTDIREVAHI